MLAEVAAKSAPDTDVFMQLDADQRKAWEYDSHMSINQTITAMTHLVLPLRVDVKLVGFEGDGNGKLVVSDTDLARYLKALQLDVGTVVLQPEVSSMIVKPQLLFHVIRCPRNLHNRLLGALHSTVNKVADDDHPHHKIDDVIRTDARDDEAAFTLYLLNPPALDYDYQYSYEPVTEGEPGVPRSCPGALWVGDQRYAWVDLSAGPSEYGPGPGHHGQVFPHTLPDPLIYKHATAGRAILPDLAALIASAGQHLVWPPLQHTRIRHYAQVTVAVVHMHDTLGPPPQHFRAEALRELLGAGLVVVTDIVVKEAWLSFAECDLCVAAYTSALKTRTRRSPDLEAISSRESRFLDKLALHTALSAYSDAIFALAGAPHVSRQSGATHLRTADPTKPAMHVIPVFMFDLSTDEPLLLDGELKAAAFHNMVLGVTTKAASAPTHFHCNFMPLELDPTDANREVLGAVMQSGWGVADSSLYHHPASGQSARHLWSIGNSPFGPYSQRQHHPLPHYLASALVRNVALAALNGSASRVVRLLAGLGAAAPDGRLSSLVRLEIRGESPLSRLRERLNVVRFKLDLGLKHLAQLDSGKALMMAKSMLHDIKALEHLARSRLKADLVTELDCEGGVSVWEMIWAPVIAIGVWSVAIAIRWQHTAFANKLEKLY
ncbi:MAG: hypothetical protein WDW38_006846 [Sanguina aurantia]